MSDILGWVDSEAPTVEHIWDVSELYLHHNLLRRLFTPGLCSFKHSPLARGLLILHSVNLLSGEVRRTNFEALLQHAELGLLTSILEMIKSSGLLKKNNAQDIFSKLLKHKKLDNLVLSVRSFYFSGILKQHQGTKYLMALLEHQFPTSICLAISNLKKEGLLKGGMGVANYQSLMEYQWPNDVATCFIALHHAGLLQSEKDNCYRDALKTFKLQDSYIKNMGVVLTVLQREGLLTHTTAMSILDNDVHILLCDKAEFIWSDPQRRFTMEQLDTVFKIAKHYKNSPTDGIGALWTFIRSGDVCLKPIQEVTSPQKTDVDASSTPFPFFTAKKLSKNKISSNDVEQRISYTTQV